MTCDEAIEQLGDSVAVYLDGGQLGGGDRRPSTIVDFSQFDEGEVLRRGAIDVAVLRETLPDLLDATEEHESPLRRSPGHEEGDSKARGIRPSPSKAR